MEQLYDFYFSEKQHNAVKSPYYAPIERPPICFFDGKQYSEMVKHGEKPESKWDDFVFIGTGTLSQCRFVPQGEHVSYTPPIGMPIRLFIRPS